MARAGSKLKVYSNDEALKTLISVPTYQKRVLKELENLQLMHWTVIPFEVDHDAKNYNYLIKNNETDSVIAYITDTGNISNINLPTEIDYFIIECNHDEEVLRGIVENHPDKALQYKRVLSKSGHLGINNCITFLQKSVSHSTKKVFLCHISQSYYEKDRFKRRVEASLSKYDLEVIELDPVTTEAQHNDLITKLYDFDNLL